jgi:hypothetical protein
MAFLPDLIYHHNNRFFATLKLIITSSWLSLTIHFPAPGWGLENVGIFMWPFS